MKKRISFSIRLKNTIKYQGKKEEWAKYTALFRDQGVEVLYKITCALDDICNGKVGGLAERHNLLSLLVTSVMLGKKDKVGKQSLEVFIKTFDAEKEKPALKRTFPNYVEVNTEPKNISELFVSVASLNGWGTKKDLIEYLERISNALEIGVILVQSLRLIYAEKINEALLGENIKGFIYMKQVASVYYTAATTKSLPDGLTIREAENVLAAVKRFSVNDLVARQYKEVSTNLVAVLEEVKDFLVDYPRSEVRVKGFRTLSLQSKKYIEV